MTFIDRLPQIIQGGMGVGVSNWHLAKTVSRAGELGVVSGTGIDTVFIRRLQLGDTGGHIRRALSGFSVPDMAQRALDKWFVPGGKAPNESFKLNSMPSHQLRRSSVELLILANYVEVALAKEGHDGLVGINYLEKIQTPTLPSLLGAMLGGVDFVLMGAGIPRAIPGVLDALSRWEPVELMLSVTGNGQACDRIQRLDPSACIPGEPPRLTRPRFLAIVSSHIVATAMARKASGTVDGLVIERHTAGGHNAPPRRVDVADPKFGPKDEPNMAKVRDLDLPFWMAGSFGSPTKLAEALALGAHGIQVGTAFAFCLESGIRPDIRRAVLSDRKRAKLTVRTDFKASPTGYPFKLVRLSEMQTTADPNLDRVRICELGYLRELYERSDGKIGYRCPAEPIDNYVSKGGSLEQTPGRQCLCNGLMATAGLTQSRGDFIEPPMVTAGEDFSTVDQLLANNPTSEYSAQDVLDYLKSPVATEGGDTSAPASPPTVQETET